MTFMSTWVCMQACVGIYMKRGIIVSPTSVKGRIWTLNKYDDDDDDIYTSSSISFIVLIFPFYRGWTVMISRSLLNLEPFFCGRMPLLVPKPMVWNTITEVFRHPHFIYHIFTYILVHILEY